MRYTSYFLHSYQPTKFRLYALVHKISTIQRRKLNLHYQPTASHPANITMTTSPEQHPTVKDSETEVSTPVEAASSDAMKNVSKEESSSSKSTDDESAKETTAKKDTKRYLPAHKKTNAALTFPEKVRYHNLAGAFLDVITRSIPSHLIFSLLRR